MTDSILIDLGLVMPHGDNVPGQHWLRQWLVAWRQQAITWINIDLSLVRSSGIHLRAISQVYNKLKNYWSKIPFKSPGTNELIQFGTIDNDNNNMT